MPADPPYSGQRMKCLVTAGPTCENLDEVRRLTNFSTGRLGSELANFMVDRGHEVTLLLGHYATFRSNQRAQRIVAFTSAADLRAHLIALASPSIQAVFHSAAVCDFTFGKVWQRSPDGHLTEVQAGKFSTRHGILLAELTPTPKILGQLRDAYPQARLIGWKYEVDGDRTGALAKATHQLTNCRTDACVVNGRAYGRGFGLVTRAGRFEHLGDAPSLYAALALLAGG